MLPDKALFKGRLTRYFRLQVFFINQCPPGPQVGAVLNFFKNSRRYSVVSTTPAKNLSLVSTTQAINPCHGEMTKKPKIFRRCRSPVSTIPPINYSAVSTTLGIKEFCLY
jgi:hypothetical protein